MSAAETSLRRDRNLAALERYLADCAHTARWRLAALTDRHAQLEARLESADARHYVVVWVERDRPGLRVFARGAGLAFGHGEIGPTRASRAALDAAIRWLGHFEARTQVVSALLATAPPASADGPAPAFLHGGHQFELRLTAACNERCVYCNTVAGSVPNLVDGPAAASAAAAAAAAHGAKVLVLTGGEPTLLPWLGAWLREVAGLPFQRITLQTNATRLARGDLLRHLATVPRLDLLVSLPGHTPGGLGAVTGRPELLGAKLEGIAAALRVGLPVALNHVLCRQNLPHFNDFTRFVQARFAAQLDPLLCSFVAPNGRAVVAGRQTLVAYAEAAPTVLAGLRLARELGLRPVMPEYCGIPTCIESGLREFSEPVPAERALEVPPDKRKFPGCSACAWSRRCSGVHSRYLQVFGPGEFAALRPSGD